MVINIYTNANNLKKILFRKTCSAKVWQFRG